MVRLEVLSWVDRVGAWLFPEPASGQLIWVPPDWEPEVPSLEVVFGDWPEAGVTGPLVGLNDPELMWRAAEIASTSARSGGAPDWRLWGADMAVSHAGESVGFGAEWVVGLAHRAAPGRVYWQCGEERYERVAAKLRRAVLGGERWRVDVLRRSDVERIDAGKVGPRRTQD